MNRMRKLTPPGQEKENRYSNGSRREQQTHCSLHAHFLGLKEWHPIKNQGI